MRNNMRNEINTDKMLQSLILFCKKTKTTSLSALIFLREIEKKYYKKTKKRLFGDIYTKNMQHVTGFVADKIVYKIMRLGEVMYGKYDNSINILLDKLVPNIEIFSDEELEYINIFIDEYIKEDIAKIQNESIAKYQKYKQFEEIDVEEL